MRNYFFPTIIIFEFNNYLNLIISYYMQKNY
nr:MAG TPA: hypothetical protein [Caudoviricetes sp.]